MDKGRPDVPVPEPAGEEGDMIHIATRDGGAPARPDPGPEPWRALPISKLRGLTLPLRADLKRCGIATCGQLLRDAGGADDRDRLAAEAGIDPDALLALVRRA